jgi:hypothetical protein
MSAYPVKMSVRVEFSDGSVHEYEVGGAHLAAPSESADAMRWVPAEAAGLTPQALTS